VLAEVGDADAWTRWGALGGERGDHLVLAQSLGGEIVGDLAGQQAEGGVELVGGEQAKHVGGDALAEADLDARVRLAEASQQPGDIEVARRHERSDPDTAAQDPEELVHFLACAVHFRQDAAGPSGDRLPRLGRADAAARALEQRGYRLIRTGSIDDAYPHLAPLLATPCDLAVYEKPLQPQADPATSRP
jgi:hypothetical protein